jgi:hypothetical protein
LDVERHDCVRDTALAVRHPAITVGVRVHDTVDRRGAGRNPDSGKYDGEDERAQ